MVSPTQMLDTTGWTEDTRFEVPSAGLVHDLLDDAAVRVPRAPAVSDHSGTVDYSELAAASYRAGVVLRDLGVRPGDVVAATAVARWEFVALLHAACREGAVFVPVHAQARPFQTRRILADAAPAVFICGDAVPDNADPQHDTVVLDWASFVSRVTRAEPGSTSPRPPKSTDPALIFYTSGSAGFPKGVVCPHAQVTFVARAVAARLRYRADDVVFVRLPLAFDYGCHQLLLCAIAGAHLVLADPADSAGMLRRLRTAQATVLPVVPSLARQVITLAGRDAEPTALRLVTNTGERLTKVDQEDLRSRFPGVRLALMYGLTECKRVSVLLLDPKETPTDTVGTPLPGTAVAVLDAQRRIVPSGVVGEIAVAGPHVADGYRHAPELNARRFAQCSRTGRRVLFTGDFGSLDQRGELRVRGRADDIFKSSGVRVSTVEVETAALDVSGVTGAVVLPPSESGSLVLWFTGPATAPAVLAGLRDRLEPAKVPADCRPIAGFPMTANGKIDRNALAVERRAR